MKNVVILSLALLLVLNEFSSAEANNKFLNFRKRRDVPSFGNEVEDVVRRQHKRGIDDVGEWIETEANNLKDWGSDAFKYVKNKFNPAEDESDEIVQELQEKLDEKMKEVEELKQKIQNHKAADEHTEGSVDSMKKLGNPQEENPVDKIPKTKEEEVVEPIIQKVRKNHARQGRMVYPEEKLKKFQRDYPTDKGHANGDLELEEVFEELSYPESKKQEVRAAKYGVRT